MLCPDCRLKLCPCCCVTNATAERQLNGLHKLIDCIQDDMTLKGLDEVGIEDFDTLGETLLAFMRFHAYRKGTE